jgi:hypothetical protein
MMKHLFRRALPQPKLVGRTSDEVERSPGFVPDATKGRLQPLRRLTWNQLKPIFLTLISARPDGQGRKNRL